MFVFFFFQAEDGIRDYKVTGVKTCALPILSRGLRAESHGRGLGHRRDPGRRGPLDRPRAGVRAARVGRDGAGVSTVAAASVARPRGLAGRRARAGHGAAWAMLLGAL